MCKCKQKKASGTFMKKSVKPTIVFGERGLKEIEYTGDLPATFGPFVTKKKYIFRPGKNPRFVDVRDLPELTKVAGRRKLRDVNESEKPKREKKEPPPIEPEETKEIEIEEVDDGTIRNTSR